MILNLFFAAQAAFAHGNVVTNGGYVVLCPSSVAQPQIFADGRAVLDIFEGWKAQGYTYKKLYSYRGQNLENAFPQAMRRFFSRSPWHGRSFQRQFANRNRMIKLTPTVLQLGTYSWVANQFQCEVEQAAVQYMESQSSPEDLISINIRSDLWTGARALPTDQKIALLVHEYLLGEHRGINESCVVNRVRASTAALLSDQADSFSSSDWSDFITFECDVEENHRGG